MHRHDNSLVKRRWSMIRRAKNKEKLGKTADCFLWFHGSRAAFKVLYWYKIQAVSKNTKYYITALQNPHAKLQHNKLVEITSRVSVDLELQLQRNKRLHSFIYDTKRRNKHKNFLISTSLCWFNWPPPLQNIETSPKSIWWLQHMSSFPYEYIQFKASRWTLSTRPQWRSDTSVATREAWKVQSWGGVYEPPIEW